MNCVMTSRRVESARRFYWSVLLILLVPATLQAADWQQVVNYNMDVFLQPQNRAVEVDAVVQYVNNSPDTLGAIWFRLPPQATRGDAPLQKHAFRGRRHRLRNVPQKDWGALSIHDVRGLKRTVEWIEDGSIARAEIAHGLLPGDTLDLSIHFTTRFPSGGAQMRLGYYGGQFKGAYWYPMICPYTPDDGWTVNRYYGTGEAYGDFGTFDLRYTVPHKYIVASTGELVNEADVLPPERLNGLSFTNPDPDPIPDGPEGETLDLWHYVAQNVPDVAFAIAPDFLIDRKDFGHFEAWAFVRRGRQQQWHDAVDVLGWTILELEDIYGPYPWPRVMMTDSWSGMEYPMLTMMSSFSPYYHYFLMHEVIHNYTPMIMHSSSVDNQSIDEGFTTFVEHILARRYAKSDLDRFSRRQRGLFTRILLLRDDWDRGIRPYYEAVLAGEDLPMVRGGDIAEDYPLLRASSYYKAPVMLNALRYVIGAEAFWSGMRELYTRHALRHLNERDIISAFSATADQPLSWFFHQFFYDNGDIDYQIDFDSVRPADHGWDVIFEVKRAGEVRLPLRPILVLANGDTLSGEIAFLATDPVLEGRERWGIWDQLHEPDPVRSFFVHVTSNSRPTAIYLDPDELLADRNPLNDSDPGPASELRFDLGLFPQKPLPMDRYSWSIRPAAGHSAASGWLAGLNLEGSWNSYLRRVQVQAFGASNSDADPLQGRVGVVHPLGTGLGPWQTVVYGGSMHQQVFGEAGMEATWRRWLPHRERFTAGIRIGGFESELGGTVETSSYMRGELGSKTFLQGVNLESQLSLASSLREEGFFSVEATLAARLHGKQWTHTFWGRLLKRNEVKLEARLGWLDGAVPVPFEQSLASLQPVRAIGSPLAGAAWRTGALQAPIINGPATFALPSPATITRFGVSKVSVGWSPGERWTKFRNPTLQNLSEMTWLSVYGGVAGTHTDPIAGIMDDVRYHIESGVELEVRDFYGLEVVARLPLVHGLNLGENGESWTDAADWSDRSPWSDLVIGVKLKRNLFLGQPLKLAEEF
jgi:hypothetical protein